MRALRVFRWESYKLARSRASLVVFILCALFCAVVLFGFAHSEFRGLKHYSGLIDPTRYINGLFFTNFVLNISFFSLLPLFAAVIPGSQIAGEAKEGTLRILLARPPSRPTVYLVKALTSYLWLQAMVFFMIAFALLIGWLFLGGGDFLVFVWEFREAGAWFATDGDWVWILLVSGLGAGMSLFMVGAFALCLSTITDNPVVAHVGALGIFFISSIIQAMPNQLIDPSFKSLMPTAHMNFWHELQHLFHPDPSRFDASRFWTDIAWWGGYTALFLTVGLVIFSRKDIKS